MFNCFDGWLCGRRGVRPVCSLVWLVQHSWGGGDWPSHSWCISASLSRKHFPWILPMMPGHASYSSRVVFHCLRNSEKLFWSYQPAWLIGSDQLQTHQVVAFEKHKFSGLQPPYAREEKERRGNKLELYVKAQDFLEDPLYKLGIFFSGMTVTALSNDSLVPRNHHRVLKLGHDLKYSRLAPKFCLFKKQ